MDVRFVDNSGQVKRQMATNVHRALVAIGLKAVELTKDNMENGYGKPIRKTGDLQRSIDFYVGRSGSDTVDIGSDLDYALSVHDGTRRMGGRAYLRDAIMDNLDELREISEDCLKEGY